MKKLLFRRAKPAQPVKPARLPGERQPFRDLQVPAHLRYTPKAIPHFDPALARIADLEATLRRIADLTDDPSIHLLIKRALP